MEAKFRLYDFMEGKMLIGEYETVADLRKAMKEFYADTEGDCYLVAYRKYVRNTGKIHWQEMSINF